MKNLLNLFSKKSGDKVKLVVGLGNPGDKYRDTRHNVGFWVVDRLAEKYNASTVTIKFNAEIRSILLSGQKVLLVKPLTYMNLSGQSVKPLMQFYRCVSSDLIVIHDDLDLESGELRIKAGGGSGGHRGINSIDQLLGAENNQYHRVRIGIGHPLRKPPKDWSPERIGRQDVADYVLDSFSKSELVDIENAISRAMDEVLRLSEFNG